MDPCYCGSTQGFSDCCKPFLDHKKQAATPEQLMRSRYTAFALKDMTYIQVTTDPQTRVDFDVESNKDWAERSVFVKLDVLKSSFEQNKGVVEFKAQFREGDGPIHVHHEISKFRKLGGVWYFRDGKIVPVPGEDDEG